MKKTFWAYVLYYPPIACRLLARTEGRRPKALTNSEIADDSVTDDFPQGLPAHTVKGLEWRTTWSGVDLPTMRAFTVGCRMDFENPDHMRRARQYLMKRLLTRAHFLKNSPEWTTKYLPMMRIYLEYLQALEKRRASLKTLT
jgi:hypothetical protein